MSKHPIESANAVSVDVRWRLALALIITTLACLRASWPTLDRYFIGDDFGYVSRFHAFPWREWPTLFVNEWSGGIWGFPLPELRPFAALTLIIDGHLWGTNPLGYHLTNFALDTGCAWLILLILVRVHGVNLPLATLAAIFFAWHPAHAEPTAWITGRVDLLATLAYLAGFFASIRYLAQPGRHHWCVMAWGAYFIGCFSKEFCLTLPLMVLGWAVIYRRESTWRWRGGAILGMGFVVIAAGFLYCRQRALGASAGGLPWSSWWTHAYAERQIEYLRWWLPPLLPLSRPYLPSIMAVAPLLVIATAIITAGSMALWRWRRPATPACRAMVFYVLYWYGMVTLPLVAAGYFSPRHLYLATAGLSLAAGLLAARIAPRRWLGLALLAGASWYSYSLLDHTRTPWRHSAKMSESFIREITRQSASAGPNTLWLIDSPATHNDAWMWSWAAPFALHPPFVPPGIDLVLTRPEAYYIPVHWSRQSVLENLPKASRFILVRVNGQNRASSQHLLPQTVLPAARRLREQLAAGVAADLAWAEFVANFPPP